ncbi:MAG: MmcB family DNA repair protein [Marivibrio sp.]|uniref:MmcB family DNA repair protein n=1 Tax=Marivibrio sp. TaxID=2039719 RepID=UPI0032EBF309
MTAFGDEDPAERSSDGPLFEGRPAATGAVTRGAVRLLREMGSACLLEVTLKTGRRADVMALDKAGGVTIVEVKSSIEDYRADSKWIEYLPFCDRFYFAVPVDFPVEILPDAVGLIVADAYGASIERPAAEGSMNASRRKALTLRYARQAAERLMRMADPGG